MVPVFGSGGSSAKRVCLSLTGKDGSGSGFGSWKTVPAVPVLLSVSGKTVPTVPVSGSSSVPEPPCLKQALRKRRHCTGVKIPKIGKRGFWGQKTPISHRPRKGHFESKNSHFPCGALKRNGDFSTQSALF